MDGVGLIMEGSAEVTLLGEHRARLGDLDLFGEMGYLSGEPATGTVKAQTPMRYVWWNKEELTRFLKNIPRSRQAVTRSLRTIWEKAASRGKVSPDSGMTTRK